MLISMNWISEFVDLSGLDKISLIKRFTLATAEVEDIFEMGKDVEGVVVAKIESVENHPDSKKLHLLKVNTGKETVDCVCGAPNVREGMKVAFATLGGKAGGMDIAKVKIAGYESCGMCCSEKELGISADHSGLMEITEDVPLGTSVKDLYDIDDIVFEVDNKSLTNRPDLWGHYGIAREFAAISGRKLKAVDMLNAADYETLPEVDIEIVDKEHGYRYTSAIIENVTRRVSPVNMRIRLFYCGMRAINFLADLTNYVMLELGQPMHAFDHNIVKNIQVRRFEEPFTFKTLDGNDRPIDENTLMICSDNKPVAVAGIMGGLDSEIVDTTTSLLLESANFDGVCIRKTSSRIGLRTDASMRYEKMLDPEMTMTAAMRYLKLLTQYDCGAKIVSRITDKREYSFPPVNIKFDKKFVDRYTGIEISDEHIVNTLTALGFKVQYECGNFDVDVPTWRITKDVTIKADIIEEITRIYGYDNFEIKSPLSILEPVPETVNRRDDFAVKNMLADKFCMNEVHSYVWCDLRKFKEIGIEVENNVRIINSLSTDWTTLRNSMVPTLLTMVNENKYFAPDFGIFEIGRVVEGKREDGTCNERKKLGIVSFGKTCDEQGLFFRMRDIVITLFKTLKNKDIEFVSAESAKAYLHPVNTVDIMVEGKKLGYMAVVHPSVKKLIDKKASIVCAQIDMDMFSELSSDERSFKEPSKFQDVDYDITVVVDKAMPFAKIAGIVKENPCEILTGYKLVDIYTDEAMAEKKSVSVRFNFCAQDRTLSSEEVQDYMNKLIAQMEAKDMMLKK